MILALACFLLAAQQEAALRIYEQSFTQAEAEKNWSQTFTNGYLKQNAIEVTPQELDAVRQKFPENLRKGRAADSFITAIATNFKAQRALYRKHGGRVALSAFGTHIAIDATVAEMKLLEKSGQVSFTSPAIRDAFYQKLLNTRGDGLTQGKNADEAFAHAPWDPKP
jgi:hypothetical protein